LYPWAVSQDEGVSHQEQDDNKSYGGQTLLTHSFHLKHIQTHTRSAGPDFAPMWFVCLFTWWMCATKNLTWRRQCGGTSCAVEISSIPSLSLFNLLSSFIACVLREGEYREKSFAKWEHKPNYVFECVWVQYGPSAFSFAISQTF
jgi:hypothetical protein